MTATGLAQIFQTLTGFHRLDWALSHSTSIEIFSMRFWWSLRHNRRLRFWLEMICVNDCTWRHGKALRKDTKILFSTDSSSSVFSRKPQIKDVDVVVGDCDTGYWHTFVIRGHQSAVSLLEMITGGPVSENVRQSRAMVPQSLFAPERTWLWSILFLRNWDDSWLRFAEIERSNCYSKQLWESKSHP